MVGFSNCGKQAINELGQTAKWAAKTLWLCDLIPQGAPHGLFNLAGLSAGRDTRRIAPGSERGGYPGVGGYPGLQKTQPVPNESGIHPISLMEKETPNPAAIWPGDAPMGVVPWRWH